MCRHVTVNVVTSVLYREAESLAYSLAVRAWRGWPRNDGCVIQFGEVCAEEEAAAAAMVMVMVWTARTACIGRTVLVCGRVEVG